MRGLHNPVIDEVLEQIEEYARLYPNEIKCLCPQCKSDIAALALKQLPPKYATTERGEYLVRVELQSRQAQLDIFRAIREAVKQVQKNPHHPPDEKPANSNSTQ